MTILIDLWLALSVIAVLWIASDCRARPQHMRIMDVTWPLTGLYFGPLALWFYHRLGRAPEKSHQHHHHHQHHQHEHHHHGHDHDRGQAVSARSTFVSTTHCGGGCALGDLIGETLVGLLSLTLFGSALVAGWTLDFVLAFGLGIVFQYLSIRPMNPDMPPAQALREALKADTFSIVAFEIGMFAIMGLRAFVAPGLTIGDGAFWLWMQGAMVAGFATSFPANWLLVRLGVKQAM
ncbi:DUF4396 domain-containing protein [Swaminathania salitolerans]|uniref:Membrane protein n=1 Tax=Swaminathania salitolerans TaxID=182838 RepID=A0A511BRI4_9PROT|nr:DUF4396 domain-containing protein [Swaminathania salitolerans]GBQ13990.1 hypothetical protein AA21291_1683 [Swaminathania salitolerans LMG 21291]GEL02875.1 membrane protein [Swaminathania salitolerans]